MLLSFFSKRCRAICAAMVGLSFCVISQLPAQQPPPSLNRQSAASDSGVDSVDLDILMRGPVHEGYAEPMVDAGGFLRLPEPPPEPIEELPAPVRPSDGQRDAVWVPGYWGVEGEADELCWVSGTWRYAPPGTRWVPGYWATVEGEAIWVPGFWVDRNITRIQYLPAPPEPRSWEPVDSPPGPDYFWVPGSWVWEGDTYAWHDGYWAQSHPDWVWIPSRFVYTPRGYIYVSGYWDYPPERRGLLFAPVRFARYDGLARPYRPSVVINVSQAFVHWFVRPQYRHYYFGDYYSDRYAQIGFSPWAGYAERVTYYDPLYVYYQSTGGGFLQNLVSARQRVVSSGEIRLPTTYSELRQANTTAAASAAVALARPVEELLQGEAGDTFANIQIEQVSSAELDQQREQITQLREFVQNRTQVEADAEARAAVSADAQRDAESPARRGAETRADGQPEDVGREAPEDQRDQARQLGNRPEEAAEARRGDQAEQVEVRREQLEAQREQPEGQREQAEAQREQAEGQREQPGVQREQPGVQREQAEERREAASERAEGRAESQQPGAQRAQRGDQRSGQDVPGRVGEAPRVGLPTDEPAPGQAAGEPAEAGDAQPLQRGADAVRPGTAEGRRTRGGFGEFDMSPYSRRGAEQRGGAPGDAAAGADAARGQLPQGLQPPDNLDRQRMQRIQQMRGGQQGEPRNPNQPRLRSPSAPEGLSPGARPQGGPPSAAPGQRPRAEQRPAAPGVPDGRSALPGGSGASPRERGSAAPPAERPGSAARPPAAPAGEAPGAPAPSPAPSPQPPSDNEGEDD